jgi:MYXO-CTERM domain-containing protein
MISPWVRCATLVVLALIGDRPATAATVKIAWDPNPEKDLAGYQLHYALHGGPTYDGTFAPEGKSPIKIPLSALADRTKPDFTLTVPSCTKFYVNLKAYDTSDNYSEFSGEISARAAYKPTNVTAVVESNGVLVRWSPLPDGDTGSVSQYLIYYDGDPGEPYRGTGAAQGDSPIRIAVQSLADLKAPQARVVSLEKYARIYFTVAAACTTGESKKSDEVFVDWVPPTDPGSTVTGCSCSLASPPRAAWALLLPLLVVALRAARRRPRR